MEPQAHTVELVAAEDGRASFPHFLGRRPVTVVPSNLDDRFTLGPPVEGGEPAVTVDMAPNVFQVTAFDDTTVEGIIRDRATGDPVLAGTRFNLGWAVV